MRVKNWARFQHFRDRRPPWIKLYRDLLDDIEWHRLDPAAAKVLVMLWLIASEAEGQLPGLQELAFRLRLPEKTVESAVSKLSHWLEQDDINAISGRYQSDSPETERETERETDDVGLSPDVSRLGKKAELRKYAAEVIAFLNAKAGRNFDVNGANADHIVARLREGATVDDCRAVIAMKCREWLGDPKMADYLRPETLFGRTKFASYKGKLGAA